MPAATRSCPRRFSPGEFYEEIEDRHTLGRELDFVWSRKYRSKRGRNTAQGNGWDFSYNSQVREIERRLADIDLDERSLRRMEGGE